MSSEKDGNESYSFTSEVLTDSSCPSVGNSSVTATISSEDKSSVKNNNLEGDDKSLENKVPDSCLLKLVLNQTTHVLDKKMPFFLSKGWRDSLCKCQSCYDFYVKNKVQHLINKDDSMEEYVEMAKQKRQENLQKQENAQMDFINTLGHAQKLEVLNGISDIRNEISAFLVRFCICFFYLILYYWLCHINKTQMDIKSIGIDLQN